MIPTLPLLSSFLGSLDQSESAKVNITWFVSEHGRCCLAGTDLYTAETGRGPGLQHHGRIHGESGVTLREVGGGWWMGGIESDWKKVFILSGRGG